MAEAAPRLYLISPPLAEATAFAASLEAALGAGDIACVLLRLPKQAPAEQKRILSSLLPLAQARGAAVLVEDPLLAVRCDADGVHVGGIGPELDAALAAMKKNRADTDKIVGVSALASRHDAMLAGEAGIDYLMFGAPDEPIDGAILLERVSWWAEIATIPCVAYAAALADVAPLAAAGADFIALGDAIWQHGEGAAAAVEMATEALSFAREIAR